MFLALFCLLTVVGAIVAWRQNPMYTLGRTLRFVGVIGLTIAALASLLWETLHLTDTQPKSVQFGATMVVVILGTMAVIGVILQLSLPRTVAMPKGTRLLRVHRAKVDAWAKRVGRALLGLGVLVIILPERGKIIIGTLSLLVVVLSCSMLFAGYQSARTMDRWLTEIELRPWVHWTYTSEQWSAWNVTRVNEVKAQPASTFRWRQDWRKPLLPLVLVCGGVYIFEPGEWASNTVYLVAIFGLVAVLVWLGQRDAKSAPDRMRMVLGRAEPEVWFGEEGMFADGVFLPWVSVGVYLIGATVDVRAPRSLRFDFVKIQAGAQEQTVTQAVMVPHGADKDVKALERALTLKCPGVPVALG